ncbi:MAG TPA: adenylate/guanylate cyclase domain-containing protein [Anaerolineales bacterium]|nr:adenylate/guanylate cyclase domain-containing protein [Anaerolineales bacterium]
MSASPLLQTLASYVPNLILQRIAANPSPTREPSLETFVGPLLFADISGFTPLTERLSRRGPAGIEKLKGILNDYFGKLIGVVREYGGDVFKFTGDGLLALWAVEGDDVDLPTLAHQALSCSQAIQEKLHAYTTDEGTLALKIALSAGELAVIHLGGVFNRWEFFIAGDPMSEVGHAEGKAKPGEIILSASIYDLVASFVTTDEFEPGFHRLLAAPRVAAPLPRSSPPLSPEMESALRAYIPGAVLHRLSALQSGFLPEMRNVTILFLNLPDMKFGVPLPQAQEVARILQSALYRYEGSVNTIGVDDKGVMFVAAMGLPPFSHEDDPSRGVRAALDMRANLHAMGWRCAIGITSGRVLAGTVGSPVRQEYNLTGDVVNLAARLMQAALKQPEINDILCDAGTYNLAKDQILFETLAPISVKGKTDPVAIFRPLNVAEHALRPPTQIVGREKERTRIAERLQTLQRGGRGGVIVLEGEAGIGKTRLVEDILRQAEAMGIAVLAGAGDAIEQGTKYHAWRPVFRQVFGLDRAGDLTEGQNLRETQRQYILAQLANDPELKQLAPLLNEVLPLDWPDSELTQEMEGETRANKTREFLLHVLQKSISQAPKLLVMEDAHWLDSTSWALALGVAQQVTPLWLVLVSRPLRDDVPLAYRQLLALAREDHFRLEPLPAMDVEQLVRQRLGVRSLPAPVVNLIRERAEGHPFFSEELAFALRDAGYLEIEKDECRLAAGLDLAQIPFPRTIEGVITRRIDRLSSEQQLAIKVASVIGRLFAVRILQDVFPVADQKHFLTEHVHALENRDLVILDSPLPDLAYLFKHIITQEVAYNMMLFAQRRDLRRAVAEWYEASHAGNLAPYYPLLAYHWGRAQVAEKAIPYLSKAGEQALRSYANQETLRFLTEAQKLSETYEVGPMMRARWLLQIGEAHLGLGNLREARESFENGLALLGEYIPRTNGQAALHLFGAVFQQMRHRFNPAKFINKKQDSSEIAPDMVQAYERLGELYYYMNQTPRIIFYDLQLINLGEAYGTSTELARGYGNLTALCGILQMHGLARYYRDQALATAAQSGQAALVGTRLTIGLYAAMIGDWEMSKRLLIEGEEVSAQLGDLRRQGQNTTVLIETLYHKGDLREGIDWGHKMEPPARRRDDIQAVGYAVLGRAECYLALGEFERGLADLEEVERLVNEAGLADPNQKIYTFGLLGAVHARLGNWSRAYSLAQNALATATGMLPTSHFIIEGYAGLVETFLRLLENKTTCGLTAKQISGLPRDVGRGMRLLQLFAFTFPLGKPYLARWQGLRHWVHGRPAQAINAWEKSLAFAQKLQMPCQQVLTHEEIARHLPDNDPRKLHHQYEAEKLNAKLRMG